MTAIFEKPADNERQHLKALFVKERVDGQPMTKILVDSGAAINIMSYAVYRKLGKGDQDLTKTDMMLKDIEGGNMCRVDHRQQNLADNFLRYQWKGCL